MAESQAHPANKQLRYCSGNTLHKVVMTTRINQKSTVSNLSIVTNQIKNERKV